jgi:hypothetical protein
MTSEESFKAQIVLKVLPDQIKGLIDVPLGVDWLLILHNANPPADIDRCHTQRYFSYLR